MRPLPVNKHENVPHGSDSASDAADDTEAVHCAIRSPSFVSLQDVTQRANSCETGYSHVLGALHDELDDPMTDDWKRLANGLDLVSYLLNTTPQLMEDLSAEPGMLRALLGFWAEDEGGVDCGEAVRSRAADLLGRIEDYELQQLEALRMKEIPKLPQRHPVGQQEQQQQQQQQQDQEKIKSRFPDIPSGLAPAGDLLPAIRSHSCVPLSTNNESAPSSGSPPVVGSDDIQRAASAFTLPSLAAITRKLPKLRLGGTPISPPCPMPYAPPIRQRRSQWPPLSPDQSIDQGITATRGSGSPPKHPGLVHSSGSCGPNPSPLGTNRTAGVTLAHSLAASGGFDSVDAAAAALSFAGAHLRSALPRGPSTLDRTGTGTGSIKRWKSGSKDLVQAWGNIRGQSSFDFARMMQQMDDDDFDAENERDRIAQQHLAATTKVTVKP